MASATEIRHHIAAVEQTKKITGAMEMVSSTRIRRVMAHIEYNRQYFHNVQRTMKEILTTAGTVSHPYLREIPEDSCCTYIVISGDKGLCGAYNHNVLTTAYELISGCSNPSIITIGNTAEDFFRSKGIIPDITVLGIVQDPTLSRARTLANDVMEVYNTNQTQEIKIVYTSFYGETKNQPVVRRLLPIRLDDYASIRDAENLREIVYHPSAQQVFDLLVPQYVLGLLFEMMVQAYASEHFARMTAMHNATTNASDMQKSLRSKYNIARQASITNEIAEITGAAEILRNGDT